MPVRFWNRTVIKPIIRTVCEMCSKKQFHYQKNVRPVSIVKFEFLGYNVCTYNMLRLLASRSSEDESRTMMESSAGAAASLSAFGDSMMTDSSAAGPALCCPSLLELELEEACLTRLMSDSLSASSSSASSSWRSYKSRKGRPTHKWRRKIFWILAPYPTHFVLN